MNSSKASLGPKKQARGQKNQRFKPEDPYNSPQHSEFLKTKPLKRSLSNGQAAASKNDSRQSHF